MRRFTPIHGSSCTPYNDNQPASKLRVAHETVGFAVELVVLLGIVINCSVSPVAQTIQKQPSLPLANSISRPKDDTAVILEPDKPIERELAGGETHVYRIVPGAAQYIHVAVDQRGIDIAIALHSPDNVVLAEMSGQDGPLGKEELSWESNNTSDTYFLEVKARAAQARRGRYEVKFEQTMVPNTKQRARIAAERLFMDGKKAQAEQKGPSLELASQKYEAAIEKWREAGVPKWEALTLQNLGIVCVLLSQSAKAANYFEQALKISRDTNDRYAEGGILNNLGSLSLALSQFVKAQEYYEQALITRREVKDRFGEGTILNNLGVTARNLGQYEKAQSYFEQALTIWRELQYKIGQANSLSNLSIVFGNLSQFEKARSYSEQALPLWRELKDKRGEASILNNLAIFHRSLSQFEKARDYYEQALTIRRETKDRVGEAETLGNLGNVYRDLGQYERAVDYFDEALKIHRETKNRRNEGVTLGLLGITYNRLGLYDKALMSLQQSVKISSEIKYRQGEADTLNDLGNVYENLNMHDKAREHYTQALSLMRELKDPSGEAGALTNIASLHFKLGEHAEARRYFQDALAIWRAAGRRDNEANTLYELGRLEQAVGNLEAAKLQIEKALQIAESVRSASTSQDIRTSYFSGIQPIFESYVDVLMQLEKHNGTKGYMSQALQANERGRARSLLETLAEAHADIRQGVDATLLERERTVQQQLNIKAQQQTKLLRGRHIEEQAKAISKEIEALTTEFQEIEAQIRQTSPQYAALTQPEPLSVNEIQTQVLDKDTILLEYSLGDERSYLWAVTPDSIKSFELPKRVDIENASRDLYALLTDATQSTESKPRQRGAELVATGQVTSLIESGTRLSQMVLGPVLRQLGKKRLLIVADGALQFVPFGSLPNPSDAKSKNLYRPLITKHEIVNLPSATVLALVRRQMKDRTRAINELAIFADPVFESDDERIKSRMENVADKGAQVASSQRAIPFVLRTSAHESGFRDATLGLPRLPGTRREAEEISSFVSPAARKVALDFAANRDTATSADVSKYRFVHFATHGVLNSTHPELSGIVLSMFNEDGTAVDGFLRMHEIFNIKMSADLVVLSACQTGLGKDVKGEGLVGLTRAFMYAGAPRVVVSLWSVNDQATAELMTLFYRGILVNKLRPAQALQAAQVSMFNDKRSRAPSNWAAFTLQGEWR